MRKLITTFLILFLMISGCLLDSSKDLDFSESIHPDDFVDIEFKNKVLLLSNYICEVGSATTSEKLEFMDEGTKAFYSGSVIMQSFGRQMPGITKYGGFYANIYQLRIYERYYNKLVKDWNPLVIKSCSIKNSSSNEELITLVQQMGEFSGKTLYLILRTEFEPIKAFSEGVFDLTKNSNIDSKIKQRIFTKFGEEGVLIYDEIKVVAKKGGNITINKLVPIADEMLYEVFGVVFREAGPYLLKSETLSENILESEIIPRTKNFFNDHSVTPSEEFGGN